MSQADDDKSKRQFFLLGSRDKKHQPFVVKKEKRWSNLSRIGGEKGPVVVWTISPTVQARAKQALLDRKRRNRRLENTGRVGKETELFV